MTMGHKALRQERQESVLLNCILIKGFLPLSQTKIISMKNYLRQFTRSPQFKNNRACKK